MSFRRGFVQLSYAPAAVGVVLGGASAVALRYRSDVGDEKKRENDGSFIGSVWAALAQQELQLQQRPLAISLGGPRQACASTSNPWHPRVLARDDGSSGKGVGGGKSGGGAGGHADINALLEERNLHLEELYERAEALAQQGQDLGEAWEEVWSASQRRDADGEAIIKELAQGLRRAGLIFTDHAFPANDAALFRAGGRGLTDGGESGKAAELRKDLAPFLAGFAPSDIQWKRASEIGPKGSSPVVFSADLSPDDIAQGNLGDCYFLAALAACATAKDDTLLNDLIVEEGHDVGLYGVKFFVNGRWVTVVVDDLFPCTQNPANGEWHPLFAHSQAHNDQKEASQGEYELWVMVMEKAFAKLHGSYEAIAGGHTEDALNYLSAGKVASFDFETDPDAWDLLISALARGQQNEDRMVFLSASIRPELSDPANAAALQELGLCTGHAYTGA